MKKYLAVFLAVIFLLHGCSWASPSNEATESTQASVTEPFVFPSFDDENSSQVFFSCQNYVYDFYPSCSFNPGITFWMVSRQHLDPEQVTVSIPITSPYSVTVYEEKVSRNRSQYAWETTGDGVRLFNPVMQNGTDFPLYLYQTYRGLDWEELGKQNRELEELQAKYIAAEPDEALEQQLREAENHYAEHRYKYAEDYQNLKSEDLPAFFLYDICVQFSFTETKDEVFDRIQVRAGEDTFDLELGEIRLHSENPNAAFLEDDALTFYVGCPTVMDSYPYGPGIEECRNSVALANDDITLTGFSLLDGDKNTAEVLEVKVLLGQDAELNGAMEILWDRQTPITVPAGTYFTAWLLVRDSRMEEPCYGGMVYPTLEYEHNGIPFTITEGISLVRMNYEPWFWYALGIDQLNLEPYFRYYHFEVQDTWRKAFT